MPTTIRVLLFARRYGVAFVATSIALLLTDAITPVAQRSPFLLILGAVMFSAWYSGAGAGILAALLTVVAQLFFVYPNPVLALTDPAYLVPLTLFLLVAAFITGLTASRRREMERAERQAALIDLSPDAVLTRRMDGTITFWSRGAEWLYGWKREEALGRRTHDLFHTQFPEPLEKIQANLDRYGQWSGDLVHTRRDGSTVTVNSRWLLRRGELGEEPTILETNTDITERQRAESRSIQLNATLAQRVAELQTLMDSAPVGIAIGHDPEGTYITSNKTLDEWLGTGRGDNISLSASPAIRPGAYQVYSNGVSVPPEELPMQFSAIHGTSVRGQELEVVRSDGTKVELLCYAEPLFDAQGKVTGSVGTFVDITARKQAERELSLVLTREQGARAQAEAALKIRDQFITVASHELKTPLTSIKGYAELLVQRGVDSGLSESSLRMLRVIDRQVGRLENMIVALLDISRIEQGRLGLELAPVDLAALLSRIVADTQPTLHRHTLTLQCSQDAVLVQADETRLEQVFQNLIQNSIKYSPFGGVVSVELGAGDGRALVTVSDHGMGIPAEDLPHIFDRFYRGANVEAFHISGLGVGLHIVREIVRLHGGDIRAESQVGQGSIFVVDLPLSTAKPPGPKME